MDVVLDAYAVLFADVPPIGETQVLTPQWTKPVSVALKRLGQGIGDDN